MAALRKVSMPRRPSSLVPAARVASRVASRDSGALPVERQRFAVDKKRCFDFLRVYQK
jgi:hypothetical protein